MSKKPGAAALVSVGNISGLRATDDLDGISLNLIGFCRAGSATGKEAIQQAALELHRAACRNIRMPYVARLLIWAMTVGEHLTRIVLHSVNQNGSIAGIRRALARWTQHDVMRIITRTERLGLITKRLPGRYETTAAGDAVIYGD